MKIDRHHARRLERLRGAIDGRDSVTPLEVFTSLGYPSHLFDQSSAEFIRAALAEIGFTRADSWSAPA